MYFPCVNDKNKNGNILNLFSVNNFNEMVCFKIKIMGVRIHDVFINKMETYRGIILMLPTEMTSSTFVNVPKNSIAGGIYNITGQYQHRARSCLMSVDVKSQKVYDSMTGHSKPKWLQLQRV